MTATEQAVRDYCQRPLERPRHSVPLALSLLLFFEAASRLLAAVLHDHWPALGGTACYLLAACAVTLVFGRWLAIAVVKCYQQYAPERVRRRCRCRPSCSHYAIAVFRRYGLIIGFCKTWRRVFRTCGWEYADDAP